MAAVTFEEALACVIHRVTGGRPLPGVATVALEAAHGRVLAEPVLADRDFPAVDRSVRDGFAVEAADTPGRLRVVGEMRAGAAAAAAVGAGEAVEIMTGAPLPAGADAVVMVEHVRREGEMIEVPAAEPGQFISHQGEEARAGNALVPAGRRAGYVEIAALAAAGRTSVQVFVRPRVAILPTGDEVVEISAEPAPHQVRNSNAHALASQVRSAGGEPEVLPPARDEYASTRDLIARGLTADLLLLSGGVSAGKYDIVERVIAGFGAEFYFDRVLIQPGQPLVFGRVAKTFFFGLPGNPASTMVTFELFARAAVELLGGQSETALPLMLARLASDFRHKPGLTRFLPALLSADGAKVTPVAWHGSSDIPALARANAFLVADAARESWKAGELIRVLMR